MVKKQIANLTSNILNPFLVSVAIIMLLSFASVSSPLDALRWSLIAIGLSVLPIFVVMVYLVRKGSLDTILTNARGQRTKIYVLSGICAALGIILLNYLQAPSLLVAAFITGVSTAVIFMCINVWWKISLHTACVAASVTVLVMLHGWTATATVALVPLTAWARVESKDHSLAQATTGALLAALIAVVVFYPFIKV
ncbi:MAG: hypothetical protein HW402_1228 [Dehalococcoidales bacterium]|nr:hypothetical protein [Dehalococcoidales bacterium]